MKKVIYFFFGLVVILIAQQITVNNINPNSILGNASTTLALGVYTGRAGWVTVYPPKVYGASGLAVGPDGKLISCLNTKTACLQEAEDFAWNHGDNLRVIGGQDPEIIPNTIGPTGGAATFFFSANAQLHIRPTQGGYTRFEQVSLIGNNPNGALIWFDSGAFIDFEFLGGQVVNTGGCYIFNPTNSITAAGFSFVGTGSSRYKLATCQYGGSQVGAEFSLANANESIVSNTFEFTELNSSNGTGTGESIKIDDPPVGQIFDWNTIHARNIHSMTGTKNVVQVGVTSASQLRILNNVFDIALTGDSSTGHGVDVWGIYNSFSPLSDSGGTHDYALYVESGACGNAVIALQVTGINHLTNGQSFGGPGMACTQVLGQFNTPGAYNFTLTSTVQYINLDGQQETIVVQTGNTASVVQICANSANCYTDGRTVGSWSLKPGMGINVTFSGSTTFVKII